MEQRIEGALDQGLESISSGLYLFSVGFGILLIIAGLFLLLKNRGSQKKKSVTTLALVCLMLGIVAIISGLMQMY